MEKDKINFHVGEPIYGKEGDELKNKIGHLIGRHNVLCSIEKAFHDNRRALEYFEEARQEVLDSGNQSIAVMYEIAIENMAYAIMGYAIRHDDGDIE